MSSLNDRTNWLNATPTSTQGGGSPITSYYQSMVALTSGDLVALYNLTVVSTGTAWHDLTSKLFTKPSDWITSLIYYPFNLPGTSVGDVYYLKLGTIEVTQNTQEASRVTCKMMPASVNNLIDMGSCYIEPHFNNFMDYNPYTNIQLYLPYYGLVDIPANEVMGKWLYVWLYIDYYTGAGIYYIASSRLDPPNKLMKEMRIISKVTCQIGYKLSIGGTNAGEVERERLLGCVNGVLGMIGGLVVSEMGSNATRETMTTTTDTYYKANRQGQMIAKMQDVNDTTSTSKTHYTGHKEGALSSAIGGTMALANCFTTGTFEKANNSVLDMAGPKCVKVVIKRPRPVTVDAWYGSLYGYPSGKTEVLGGLTGFTKVANIHLDGFATATSDELSELNDILTSGVIL